MPWISRLIRPIRKRERASAFPSSGASSGYPLELEGWGAVTPKGVGCLSLGLQVIHPAGEFVQAADEPDAAVQQGGTAPAFGIDRLALVAGKAEGTDLEEELRLGGQLRRRRDDPGAV
jgi:hypothetical protein